MATDCPNLQVPKAIMLTEDVSVEDYIASDLYEFKIGFYEIHQENLSWEYKCIILI
jgi:hypothetical protein